MVVLNGEVVPDVRVDVLPMRPDVALPSYATDGAAGLDVRAWLPEGQAPLVLHPGGSYSMPLGFATAFRPGFGFLLIPRSGTGSNLDEKRPGTFVDPISGVALFRSDTKFESGTGWPSFFNPLPGAITLHEDVSMGMKRVEVRSASSGIHLGHVFDDGPPPTHKRYCINGNVLKFVPDQGR